MQRLSIFIGGFGLVAEAFDSLGDLDKCAECGDPQDFPVHHVANVMAREERFPDIGLQLLHAQGQTALVRFDGKHNRLHAIAFFQNFRRMFHTLGPAQIADVNQAVDAVFDLDEGSEVSEVANASFDGHADRELLMQRIPRVCCQLAHSQRNAALHRIHVEHHALYMIANVDHVISLT